MGSDFRRRGVRFWGLGVASTGVPAEAQRAGREANSGAICGGVSGVLAGPARGIFLEICSHMCRVPRILIAVQASSSLCRIYSYNHDFWDDFPYLWVALMKRRATVCNSPLAPKLEPKNGLIFGPKIILKSCFLREVSIRFLALILPLSFIMCEHFFFSPLFTAPA